MNRAARRAKQRAWEAARPERVRITRTIAEENAIARAAGMQQDPYVIIPLPTGFHAPEHWDGVGHTFRTRLISREEFERDYPDALK